LSITFNQRIWFGVMCRGIMYYVVVNAKKIILRNYYVRVHSSLKFLLHFKNNLTNEESKDKTGHRLYFNKEERFNILLVVVRKCK
jgi:hypothetical protein